MISAGFHIFEVRNHGISVSPHVVLFDGFPLTLLAIVVKVGYSCACIMISCYNPPEKRRTISAVGVEWTTMTAERFILPLVQSRPIQQISQSGVQIDHFLLLLPTHIPIDGIA